MMNLIVLEGRLTKDPEICYSQGENPMAVARWTLAVAKDQRREGEPEADFIPHVAFGNTAERVEKYLRKGSHIITRGRLKNNDYTNQEGRKIHGFQVMTDYVRFLDKKEDTSSQPPVEANGDGFMNIPDGIDEESPFD